MSISRIIAAIVFAGVAGSIATPALADWHHDRDRDRHWHERDHWRRPYGDPYGAVIVAPPPPAVYAPPPPEPMYVAPPPVIGFGLNFNLR